MFKKMKSYFSTGEISLWCISVIGILLSFLLFDRKNVLTLTASFIGVTSLLFNAKGNPVGQILMVIFSLLYGIISWTFAYYGEMLTYLGMTAPMSVFALISWLRNPYNGNKSEVKIENLSKKDIAFMLLSAFFLTVIFYFMLKAFRTANLIWSTISVTTSFFAVYLTYKRSAAFALAYAANDVILILLWLLAALSDSAYLSVVVCFFIFLICDVYTFINWKKIYKHQKSTP